MKMILAMANNGVIGKDNKLAWRLPEDLKHFKEMTWGNTVVMGRKTYESLKDGALPFRKNIVLTRDMDYELEDAEVMHCIREVLDYQKENPDEEIWIIGGATIYDAFEIYVDEIHMTFVDLEIEGDAFFKLNRSVWAPTEEPQLQTNKNGITYSFSILRRLEVRQ